MTLYTLPVSSITAPVFTFKKFTVTQYDCIIESYQLFNRTTGSPLTDWTVDVPSTFSTITVTAPDYMIGVVGTFDLQLKVVVAGKVYD